VALLMLAFLVGFGVVALPAELQERWIGASVTTLLEFELLGEWRRLSRELITVAAMLSGIVGLYYTGLAITEPARRGDEFRHAIMEVRQILSVRSVYRSALASVARVDAEPAQRPPMASADPTRDAPA
jgi:hypothetical protein